MTLDDLKKLTPVELDFIAAHIYKLVKDKVTEDTKNEENFNHDPDCCPHCGSLSFIKYGFNKGKQKYYCKDCNKFFSKTTGTLYHRSENEYVLWKNFIGCEINGLTLVQESVSIGKCKTTCFNMRHKLYKAIEDIVLNTTLSGLIEIDAQYTKINLKGTKPNKMPRHSKKRGNKAAFSGISHHKICLITSVDENDNMLFRIAGLGPESIDKYLLFKDCFKEGSTFISDSKAAIKKFAQEISCSIEQIPVVPNKKRYATKNNHTVSNVNQIHSELSILISKKHGISTRHLQDYLNWLLFLKKIKYKVKAEARVSFTYMESMKQVHTIAVRNITKLPMPIDLYEAYGEYHYGIYS